MKQYDVMITETLQKKVTIDANSREEAHDIVAKRWHNGDYILDADAFVGVEFSHNQPVTFAEMKNAYAYLCEFATDRSPRTVNIGAIINLSSVYPDQVVFSLLSPDEKQGLIDYVEMKIDYAEIPNECAYRLYEQAIQEKVSAASLKPPLAKKSPQKDMVR